jgi:hypothetical protein
MLESKDHQQILVASGALDLTFANDIAVSLMANVKSAPLRLQAGLPQIE